MQNSASSLHPSIFFFFKEKKRSRWLRRTTTEGGVASGNVACDTGGKVTPTRVTLKAWHPFSLSWDHYQRKESSDACTAVKSTSPKHCSKIEKYYRVSSKWCNSTVNNESESAYIWKPVWFERLPLKGGGWGQSEGVNILLFISIS